MWARLQREGSINEITPLNRAELRESVVFLHCHNNLTVLMNDPQTADELPTKIITFVCELNTDATINEVTPLNRGKLCESGDFLYIQRSLIVLMNDLQTADELQTKII